MRILGLYHTSEVGGGEVSFTLSLKLARDLGHEVHAVVPAEGAVFDLLARERLPVTLLPMPSLRSPGGVVRLFRPRSDWQRLISEFRPDLLHANAVRAALYGQAIGRTTRVRTIFHARIAEPDPIADPFLMGRVDAIFGVSRIVLRRFSSCDPDRLHLLPNAVDIDAFRRPSPAVRDIRRKWLGDGRILIGVVGALDPGKGPDLAVEAMARVLDRMPHVRLVFIGPAAERSRAFVEDLRRRIVERGLDSAVHLAGVADAIVDAYHALDLVLFPSRSEGFGRVIIEAGAAGRPVVATNIPAFRELMPPELAGHLVRPDPESMAVGIMRLVADDGLRQQSAATLADHVAASFGADSHGPRLEALYQQVLKYPFV